MAKHKAQYPEDFKTMFGVSTMSLTQVVGGAIMTGYLMLYITDYAGLYTGIAGKAAQVATLMLLIGRIWDAVNDPILGFLMDRSPRTKWGKFKPFMFVVTLVSDFFFLLIGLFNIPTGMSDTVKVALLYLFYLLFDSAFTLLPILPLTQSLSNDASIRSKLLAAPESCQPDFCRRNLILYCSRSCCWARMESRPILDWPSSFLWCRLQFFPCWYRAGQGRHQQCR